MEPTPVLLRKARRRKIKIDPLNGNFKMCIIAIHIKAN